MSEDPLLHEANRRAHRLAGAPLKMLQLLDAHEDEVNAWGSLERKRHDELHGAARAYEEIELRRQKEATL